MIQKSANTFTIELFYNVSHRSLMIEKKEEKFNPKKSCLSYIPS